MPRFFPYLPVLGLSLTLLFVLGTCTSPSNKPSPNGRAAPSEATTKTIVDPSQPPQLTLLWETDTLLRTVESVHYDAITQALYTANIDGHFMAKDGRGSIAKVSLDGDILEAEWLAGLDAPTGLCTHRGQLFTTDIDRVHRIDLASGTLLETIPLPEAKALNDITADPQGKLYCSDTAGDRIFSCYEGVVETALDSIRTPNGLYFHQSQLYVAQWTPQRLQSWNPQTGELIAIAAGLPQADGLEALTDGSFWVSSWGGMVHWVAPDGQVHQLLDTRAEGIQAADLTWIPERQCLVVACFDNHRLRACRFQE